MIEVENLVKKYGSHVAVDHLSFHVNRGQIYGFLGPNGAGKSTTMNMMTGYLAATEGTIKINGYDIATQPEEAKKCIGYLPELPPLYQEMTVREYLTFAAELKKIPRKDRMAQIDEVMEMTMLTEVEHRLIRNLSKGYKQRVGLAQAILGFPEVIILDEPPVGLDPKQITEIRDLIRRLGEKHTVILSSHILSEVSAICDHIMIISQGKLVASDSSEELQKRMSGTARLNITVLGTKEQTAAALQTISALKEEEVSYIQSTEKEVLEFVVETDSAIDMRRAVGTALAKAQIPVIGMTREERTLEDIFLALTDSEQEEALTPGEKTEQTQALETAETDQKEEKEDGSNI